MKIIAFLLVFTFVNNDCTDMNTIRKAYHEVVSEKDLNNFIKLLESRTCEEIEPYIASSIMQKSEHAFITKKMKYFKEGKERLESFITKNPNNVEAKYIRYLIQKEIPSFLNYKENIAQDSLFIVENISSSNLPMDYQKLILKNISQ